MERVEKQLEETETKRNRAQAKIKSLNAQVKAKGELESQWGQQLGELRKQLGEVLQKIGDLQDDAGAGEMDELKGLETERRGIQAKIDELKDRLESVAGEIKEARAGLEPAAATVATCKADEDKLDGQCNKLVAQKKTVTSIMDRSRSQHDLNAVLTRIHQRLAWAISILAFALVGVPMGILAGGRNVMVAFGLSFALALLLFYVPLNLGTPLAKSGRLAVLPAMWTGNCMTFVLGIALMARVVRR